MDAEYILERVQLGMTRAEVRAVLGEPHDYNIGSRKYPKPMIYKYGEIELHFAYPDDGPLVLVYTEDDERNGITLLGPLRK